MTEPTWKVHVINAYERMDGVYVFRGLHDAERFAAALDARDVPYRFTEETVCDRPEADDLIEAESA